MNFKEIIKKYILFGENQFSELVTRLYNGEDNFNNADPTSNQHILMEWEIEGELRQAYQEHMSDKFDWLGLELDIKKFDYTYENSDDNRIWTKWSIKERELRQIIEQALKIDASRTNKLILKYKKEFGTCFKVD